MREPVAEGAEEACLDPHFRGLDLQEVSAPHEAPLHSHLRGLSIFCVYRPEGAYSKTLDWGRWGLSCLFCPLRSMLALLEAHALP